MEKMSNFQFGDVDSLYLDAVNKKDTGREIALNHRKEELLRLILGSKDLRLIHVEKISSHLELKLVMFQERLG